MISRYQNHLAVFQASKDIVMCVTATAEFKTQCSKCAASTKRRKSAIIRHVREETLNTKKAEEMTSILRLL